MDLPNGCVVWRDTVHSLPQIERHQKVANAVKPHEPGATPPEDNELTAEFEGVFRGWTAHLDCAFAATCGTSFYSTRSAGYRPVPVEALMPRFRGTGNSVRQAIRPLKFPLKEELERQVRNMLQAGVVRLSKRPWASAPVFIKKESGEWRMCLDYRLVNLETAPNSYPLPRIWENQEAAGHKYYVCLDCFWGV